MEFALLIYLSGVFENVQLVLTLLALFGGAVLTAFSVIVRVEEEWEKHGKPLTYGWKVWGIAVLVAVLLPSEGTTNKMLVAYGAQTIATTEAAGEIGGKSVEAINKLLDDYLAEE